MKTYVLKSIIFVSGVIIGAIISAWILGSSFSDARKTESLFAMSELETIASKIYESGDYESSIIILEHLAERLKQYEEALDDPAIFRTDRGLAHGRLFKIYQNKGKEELAEKEFGIAVELLRNKYKVATKDDLSTIVDKYDQLEEKQKNNL